MKITRDFVEPGPSDRVAVIGDVHGHLGEFLAALHSLGVRFGGPSGSLAWPEDLFVIQVGDQVHKGPDSLAVLDLRDELVASSGGRFVDLFGNHESQYVWGTVFFTTEPGLQGRIRRDSHRRAAFAVSFSDGAQVLCTHAGLTFDFWASVCGSSLDARLVAERLNRAWVRRDPRMKNAGTMLYGQVDFMASPVWAHCTKELTDSWDDAGVVPPFLQVVGHTNPSHPVFGGLPSDAFVAPVSDHTFVFRSGELKFAFVEANVGAAPPAKGIQPLLLPAVPPLGAASPPDAA